MKEQIKARDINLFRVGQTVTVPDCPAFRETKILAINDSGVYVSSNEYPWTVISGKSPAILFEENKTVLLTEEMQKVKIELETLEKEIAEMENGPNEELLKACKEIRQKVGELNQTEQKELHNRGMEIINSGKVERGSYTEKMKHLTLPNGKFTIAQLAELNNIPPPYANKYVKDQIGKTIIEAGHVEKPIGQKGRVAALFEVKN